MLDKSSTHSHDEPWSQDGDFSEIQDAPKTKLDHEQFSIQKSRWEETFSRYW
jgi:hypothetical protein